MDSNLPCRTSLDEDKNLVVAAYRFPILSDHSNHCDVATCEIDRFNRSLNLARQVAPQFGERGPSANRVVACGRDPFAVYGIHPGYRLAVMRVPCLGKSLDKRPYGLFLGLTGLGGTNCGKHGCQNDSRQNDTVRHGKGPLCGYVRNYTSTTVATAASTSRW